uniref:Uncharacterized protein n=1 Tax=Parascaris equorum TaxID=6256 RepID=A0A914RZQ7_PAREQ
MHADTVDFNVVLTWVWNQMGCGDMRQFDQAKYLKLAPSLSFALMASIHMSGYPHPYFSQQEDALLTYLLDTEVQAMSSVRSADNSSPIGIARVKPDPDLELSSIFKNRSVLDTDRFDMSYEVGRVASVEQLAQATRRYIAAAVDWIEALFALANVDNIHDKVRLNIISHFFTLFYIRTC